MKDFRVIGGRNEEDLDWGFLGAGKTTASCGRGAREGFRAFLAGEKLNGDVGLKGERRKWEPGMRCWNLRVCPEVSQDHPQPLLHHVVLEVKPVVFFCFFLL